MHIAPRNVISRDDLVFLEYAFLFLVAPNEINNANSLLKFSEKYSREDEIISCSHKMMGHEVVV
jgi:hypothetical protein